MSYYPSGDLTTDSREVAADEEWSSQSDWEANQDANDVVIDNGTVRLEQLPDFLTVEDFEWGGPVDDRYSYDTSDYTIDESGEVFNGVYSLKNNNSENAHLLTNQPVYQLPAVGDTHRMWAYMADSNSGADILWGHDSTEPTFGNTGYGLRYIDNGVSIITWDDGNLSEHATASNAWSSGSWYGFENTHESNGDITLTILDSDESEIDTITFNDSSHITDGSYDNNYIGLNDFRGVGDAWDSWHIVS